ALVFACYLIITAHRMTTRDVQILKKKDEELRQQAETLKATIGRLQIQTEMFKMMLESIGDGLMVADNEMNFLHFNTVARELLGFGPEEIKTRREYILENNLDFKTMRPLGPDQMPTISALNGNPVNDLEVLCQTNPDGPRVLSFTSRPIRGPDTKVHGAITVFRDITEKKEIEQSLQRAEKAALDVSRMKSRFLANMSHEIRTPLNGIIGLTELLANTLLSEEQLQFTQLISASGEQLMTIISDILDFSKIEAGKMSLEKVAFDPVRLAHQTLQLMQPRAKQKGISLELKIDSPLPSSVVGDPVRISQVLNNFTGNAIKFTPAGKVIVELKLIKELPDAFELEFSVHDTGIGISEAEQGRLFEPFTQAHESTSRNFGGTGLGLSICKQLTELMGGQIGVDSSPGKGSRFWFQTSLEKSISTPIQKTNPISSLTSSPEQNHTPEKYLVLVAEDNPVNQLITMTYLKDLGYRYDLVENGEQAVDAFKNKKYDLILMDCQMPGVDGYEATARIRKLQKTKIPIIAVTAHAMKNEEEKCLNIGMDGILRKPFQRDQLQKMILPWLERDKTYDFTILNHFKGISDENGQDLRKTLIETY
ncbi:MAG: hypothetical protein COT73_06885, partial [Bdellovibrio sp. CG10_big_fil_rev_8_21_14_0_10_47_8]